MREAVAIASRAAAARTVSTPGGAAKKFFQGGHAQEPSQTWPANGGTGGRALDVRHGFNTDIGLALDPLKRRA